MEILGLNELLAKAEKFKVALAPVKMVEAGDEMVILNIKTKQLAHQSGPPLPTQLTARHGGAGISGAIKSEVQHSGQDIIGHIGVSADSVAKDYARIHEFGGTFPHPATGVEVLMPPRPYLRPGLEDELPHVIAYWKDWVTARLRGAGLI